MQVSTGVESPDLPSEPRSFVRRILDWIFGYDFFISYAWRDGGVYAERLARHLERDGFEIFLDRDDFVRGDDWKRIGTWTLRRTGQLILVGSPLALTSAPVRHEVEAFSATRRRIVPIAFGGSLDQIDPSNPLSKLLPAELLQITEAREALGSGPTDEALLMIRHTFDAVRQDKKRLRILGAVALVLALLAAVAGFSAVEARRKAAEAASRLAEQRAFQAFVDWDTNPTRAFALSMEALEAAPGGDRQRPAYLAMASNLFNLQPVSVRNLEVPAQKAAIAADGAAVVLSSSGRAQVIDAGSEGLVRITLEEPGSPTNYRQFMFSPDGSLIAGITKPAFAGQNARDELVLWSHRTGRLVARSPIGFGTPGSASIAGFDKKGELLFVEASGEEEGFQGASMSIRGADIVLQGPLRSSPVRFALGRVDFESGLVVASAPSAKAGTTIEVLGLDGRPAPGWPPIARPGTATQLFLAPGGNALAIVEALPGGGWKTSMLSRGGGGPAPAGAVIATSGRPFIWDVTTDGSMGAVMVSDAPYPAETWDFRTGRRASIPVSSRVSSPFVMASGEEHRVVDFIENDTLVLVREPEEGLESQNLWLFDRATLALRAMPHRITTDHAAARPLGGGARFARLSRNGMLEVWDLRASGQPVPLRLALDDLILSARFFDGDRRLLTVSRSVGPNGYAARIDLWDAAGARHQVRIPGRYSTRTKAIVSPDGSLLVIASIEGKAGPTSIRIWRLPGLKLLRSVRLEGTIEALSFKASERLMAGGRDRGERVIVFDLAVLGRDATSWRPPLPPSQTHVAFSADGRTLILDYDYSSLALWPIGAGPDEVRRLTFSNAAGMPFDLAYDIVAQLKAIAFGKDGPIKGQLGSVAVEIRREGQGTEIIDVLGGRPLLTALERSSSRLYPVRGADLLDAGGRWFALTSNSASLANASYLRVYDVPSGFPISGRLVHQFLGRPGAGWPQLWSEQGGELDPIQALAFSPDGSWLTTLTTDGIIRHWPVMPGAHGGAPWSNAATEVSAAITGRRLIGGGAIERRLPDAELISLRKRRQGLIDAMRRPQSALPAR